MSDRFTFTVTDAARFLGKSAVTLRKWERQGLITYPRVGDDRRFTSRELRELSNHALIKKRITHERWLKISAALTLLEIIEDENRTTRSTGVRQVQVGEGAS